MAQALVDGLLALPGPALFALGAAVLLVAVYLLHSSPPRALFTRRRADLPHHKKAVPILGDMLHFAETSDYRLEALRRNFDELGEVWHSSIYMPLVGPLSVVNTLNPQDVETVLRDPYTFIKGDFSATLVGDFLGHGIFASDGARWHSQRKTASHIFNVKSFRDVFSGDFLEEVAMLCSHLESAAKQNAVVDLQDSFGRLAMGTHFGCIEQKGTVVDGCYVLPEVEFMKAFDYLNSLVASRFPRVGWAYLEKLDGTRDKVRAAQKTMFDVADRVIAEKRKKMESDKDDGNGEGDSKGHKDMLDYFMRTKNFDGSTPDDEELRDVVMNLLIAGRDTTAQTLTWAFYALSQNPEIEAKCRAEVAALGDELPSYENLGRLKYLNATFNETLRLYANVPTNQLTCTKDTVLAGSGTMVYAGELVQYSPHTMGYSTKLWGPDAEAFKPDRWFDEKGTLKKVSQYTWPVFKGGPRVCLGQNMATQEGITFLAQILRRFKLELVGEDKPEKWGRWDPDPAKREGRYSIALTLGARDKVEFKVTLV